MAFKVTTSAPTPEEVGEARDLAVAIETLTTGHDPELVFQILMAQLFSATGHILGEEKMTLNDFAAVLQKYLSELGALEIISDGQHRGNLQ